MSTPSTAITSIVDRRYFEFIRRLGLHEAGGYRRYGQPQLTFHHLDQSYRVTWLDRDGNVQCHVFSSSPEWLDPDDDEVRGVVVRIKLTTC